MPLNLKTSLSSIFNPLIKIVDIPLIQKLITDWNTIYSESIIYENKKLSQISLEPKKIDFEELLLGLNKLRFNNNHDLGKIFIDYYELKKEEKKLSKSTSLNFNVLDFFSISETLHSKILGFFLHRNETHGQEDLFLKKFLEKLGFLYNEGSEWHVALESHGIDILIWRNNPHSVVIIENKSNNAIDQNNQLYRYWFNTVYSKMQNDNVQTQNYSNYKIIYLVSSEGKVPSLHSLKKPDNWSDDFPKSIPEEMYPEIWFFRKQIKEILSDALNEIDDNNHRLREYIKQYIEYWIK